MSSFGVRCDVCNVTVTSHNAMPEHILGKKHQEKTGATPKQKARAAKAAKLQAMSNRGKVWCDVCNLDLPSAKNMPLHVQGKRHQENARNTPEKNTSEG